MTEALQGLLVLDQLGSEKSICSHLLVSTPRLEIKKKAEGILLYLMFPCSSTMSCVFTQYHNGPEDMA